VRLAAFADKLLQDKKMEFLWKPAASVPGDDRPHDCVHHE
jgi:hypothetical protein